MAVPLLQAYPHKYGPGQVHRFDPHTGRTICGLTEAKCPGALVEGELAAITCKNCLSAIERARRFRHRLPEEQVYCAGSVIEDSADGSTHVVKWRQQLWGVLSNGEATMEAGREQAGRFIYGGPTLLDQHGVIDVELPRKCLQEVLASHCLFAWFDTTDTAGTLVEIGFAFAHHKPIFIAFASSQLAHHFYFAAYLATTQPVVCRSVREAWDRFTMWRGGA